MGSDPMIPAILLVLSTLAVAFVLQPLLQRASRGTVPSGDREQEILIEQRESAYEAMNELDFDRELGKLDESDYRRLYERYRRQAVSALKATREREAVFAARIEEQVQQARLAGTTTQVQSAPQVDVQLPRRLAFFERSVTRRPAEWLSSLAVLFVLFASGTWWVWSEGMRSSANAAPIGRIAGGTEFTSLLLDARQAGWALSGDLTGLRRSPDGGETWSSIPVLAGQVTGLTQSADGKTQYALVNNRLQRSNDEGQTWVEAGVPPRDARLASLAADPADPDNLYALDSAGALFRSPDRGESWSRLEYGPAGPPTSLSVAVSEPLQLFASVEGAGVVAGSAGRWSVANGVINGRLPTDVIHSVLYDPTTGATSTMPDGQRTEGTLYAATDQGVFRSTDYGQDWFRLGPDADIRTIAVGPRGTELLLAVSSTGEVYRSTDRGITWSDG